MPACMGNARPNPSLEEGGVSIGRGLVGEYFGIFLAFFSRGELSKVKKHYLFRGRMGWHTSLVCFLYSQKIAFLKRNVNIGNDYVFISLTLSILIIKP